MGNPVSVSEGMPAPGHDRRTCDRVTMVLRVGLLEFEGKSAFCLLRNISSQGVQLKLYAPLALGTKVNLRVGDENIVEGHVAWACDGLAGIDFIRPLDPAALLRVRQAAVSHRRRASPRAQASGFAVLRTGGQEYPAKLCDISASGAKILTARSIKPGGSAILLLPKMPALRAYVRWTCGQDTGLLFETPIPIQIITDWLAWRPDVAVS